MTADINVEIRELIFGEHHKCYVTVRLDSCMDKMSAIDNNYLKMDIYNGKALISFYYHFGIFGFSFSLNLDLWNTDFLINTIMFEHQMGFPLIIIIL